MVETDMEVECRNCSRKFWYSGDKIFPSTVECPKCNFDTKIPEEA